MLTARETILDLLARDAAPCDTLCGVLDQQHRDALIHVINGGHLDVEPRASQERKDNEILRRCS